MIEVIGFVAALARTGKGMKKIKILTDQAYGNMGLKGAQL
jgi:hypothetical protein